MGGGPAAPLLDVDREHRRRGRRVAVLLVPLDEQLESAGGLLAVVEDATTTAEPHPPEPAPVLVVAIDEDRDLGPHAGVLDPAERPGAFRLRVDGGVEGVTREREDDRDEMRPAVRVGGREVRDSRSGHALPQ